jgi:hypothetical protein
VTLDEAIELQTTIKRAYQLVFDNPGSGAAVLLDLGIFCRARETCVIPGDRDLTYVLEGRREVYLRIRDYLDLTPEQLVERYTTPAQGAQGNELP